MPAMSCFASTSYRLVWGIALGRRPAPLRSGLRACDLLLVIGTSGVVYPAAGFASVAKEVGALVIEINLESTPQSNLVDLSLQGRAKDLVPLLL